MVNQFIGVPLVEKRLLDHYEVSKMSKEKRKYDITIDGYKIRNDADFDRVDMNKSERRKKHRKAKLEKKQIP